MQGFLYIKKLDLKYMMKQKHIIRWEEKYKKEVKEYLKEMMGDDV